MHKSSLLNPWSLFTRKLVDYIDKPKYVGILCSEDAVGKEMRLVVGKAEKRKQAKVQLFMLVDESDGVIADVRFQVFGPPALIGIAEALCSLLIRKNYDQAKRLDAEWIDKQLRDKKDKEVLFIDLYPLVNLVLEASDEALGQCEGISLPEEYIITPVQTVIEGGPYPGWDELSQEQQIAILEHLFSVDIRPYVELDAGGIEIVSLTGGRELVIAYRGACTTCPSSIGSTLQAIQQIVAAKIHPDLTVVPDRSFFGI